MQYPIPVEEIPHLHRFCVQHHLQQKHVLLKNYSGDANYVLDHGYASEHVDIKGVLLTPTPRAFDLLRSIGLPLTLKQNETNPIHAWHGLRIESDLARLLKVELHEFHVIQGAVIEFRDAVTGDRATQYDIIAVKQGTNVVHAIEVKFRMGDQNTQASTLWVPQQDSNAVWVNGGRMETGFLNQVSKQRRVIQECATKSLKKLNFHLKYKFTQMPVVHNVLYWYGMVKIGDDYADSPIHLKRQLDILPATLRSNLSIDSRDVKRLATMIRMKSARLSRD